MDLSGPVDRNKLEKFFEPNKGRAPSTLPSPPPRGGEGRVGGIIPIAKSNHPCDDGKPSCQKTLRRVSPSGPAASPHDPPRILKWLHFPRRGDVAPPVR